MAWGLGITLLLVLGSAVGTAYDEEEFEAWSQARLQQLVITSAVADCEVNRLFVGGHHLTAGGTPGVAVELTPLTVLHASDTEIIATFDGGCPAPATYVLTVTRAESVPGVATTKKKKNTKKGAAEAMAPGVSVVARPVAGVEDYLEDGVNGWSCPARTQASVAAFMVAALADPRRPAIESAARRMVERRNTWSHTVRVIDSLYEAAS